MLVKQAKPVLASPPLKHFLLLTSHLDWMGLWRSWERA